jgi:hypothetical protein
MEWPRGGRGGIAALAATLQPSRRRCSPRGDVAALAATLQPSWRRCSPSGEIVAGENRDIAALPRCSIVGAALPRYRQHASGGARPRTSIVGCGLAASRQSLALQRRGSRWRCTVAVVVGLAASRQSLALRHSGDAASRHSWRCGRAGGGVPSRGVLVLPRRAGWLEPALDHEQMLGYLLVAPVIISLLAPAKRTAGRDPPGSSEMMVVKTAITIVLRVPWRDSLAATGLRRGRLRSEVLTRRRPYPPTSLPADVLT